VLGVLPYLDLDIPSEDSVSLGDKKSRAKGRDLPEMVEIAVIRLPRISNFTDFEPLERHARVRYVGLGEPLGQPDAVIIPGTKNTVSDLTDMQESGMDRQILSLSLKDTPIIGICGGYQILGKEIVDCGVEDTVGTVLGLGLLDAVTRFDLYEKRTVQVKKTVTGKGPILDMIRGQEISGYEIHMGVTSPKDGAAFGDDGAVAENGLVMGTYLHGLFENENFRNAFLDYLYSRKNLSREGSSNCKAQEGKGFDELALAVESELDMERIWRMLDLSNTKLKNRFNHPIRPQSYHDNTRSFWV
jgi:adenosylcobyric acid synthase